MQYASKRRTPIVVGLVLLILIVFHVIGWLQPVESKIRTIFSQGFFLIRNLTDAAGGSWQSLYHRNELSAKYVACMNSQVHVAESSAAKILLARENAELRRQLSFKAKQVRPLVVAEVIGRELSNNTQMLLIDRGSLDGIRLNQSVVVDNGVLVGKIVKVERDSAAVRLITDSDSKIAATLLNREASIGVVEGGFGISLQMKFIPRNETINIGDQVVTSGFDTTTLRGLLIGSVAVVENEAYQPFQQAVLTPIIDLDKVTIVGVIIDSGV